MATLQIQTNNVLWSKESSFEKEGLGIVVSIDDEEDRSRFNETMLERVEYLGNNTILHLHFTDNGSLYISSEKAIIWIGKDLRNGAFILT